MVLGKGVDDERELVLEGGAVLKGKRVGCLGLTRFLRVGQL